MRNAFKFLIRKSEGNRPFGRPVGKWEDDVKVDIRDMRFEGVD
jgi:hypothetical protein